MNELDATHKFVYGNRGAYGSVCAECGLSEGHKVHDIPETETVRLPKSPVGKMRQDFSNMISAPVWQQEMDEREARKAQEQESYEERMQRENDQLRKSSRFVFRLSLVSLGFSTCAFLYNLTDGWLF